MPAKQPSRWRQVGADGAWTLLLSCLLIVATLGTTWLLLLWRVWRMALQTPAQARAQDWIVVLGRQLLGSAVTVEYATRLRRAELLWRAGDGLRIMVLGGHTSEGPFSEAQQGLRFLLQRGLPATAIHTEDRSQHTLENLQNARRLLGGGIEKPMVLITSRYHLARCHALAAGMALPHVMCAAEEDPGTGPGQFLLMLREAFFLHWYLVGRGWSTVIRSRKTLARIS